jgi:hypothetical protein
MRLANRLLALAFAPLVAFAAAAEEPAAHVRLLVQSSPLAGIRYYDAREVAAQLRVGDRLELAREGSNPHDANAVAVFWQGRKLGYVPRRENAVLAWALDRGEALHARISRLSGRRSPARRIELEIYMQ